MQNDPDQATESMGDGADGLIVSQARHQSAIDDLEGKSFLRPRRPRFDRACARWSVPDIGPAPSRFWQLGFQYRSSAPQTGFNPLDFSSIRGTVLARRKSDDSSHQHIPFAERGDDLESLLLEHRHRSSVVRVSSPAFDWIGFD